MAQRLTSTAYKDALGTQGHSTEVVPLVSPLSTSADAGIVLANGGAFLVRRTSVMEQLFGGNDSNYSQTPRTNLAPVRNRMNARNRSKPHQITTVEPISPRGYGTRSRAIPHHNQSRYRTRIARLACSALCKSSLAVRSGLGCLIVVRLTA